MNRRKVLEEEYKLGVCITLRLIPKSLRVAPNVQAINDEPNYLKHREREVSESVRSVTAKTFDREKPDGVVLPKFSPEPTVRTELSELN